MSGARYSMFVSFRNGLQALVEELMKQMPEVEIHYQCGVRRVNQRENDWLVETDKGDLLDADGVIIAAPAHAAAKMLRGLCESEGIDSSLSENLAGIEYASSAIVHLAYREADLPKPLDGFGFVVPAKENRSIIACSFTSVKFEARAPEGIALLRCFIGGAIQPECYELDDADMLAASRREVRDFLGITAGPMFHTLHRHPLSMPQYAVGHLDLCDRIEAKAGAHAGLALAGSAFRGVGIPDCIHSGETAAERVIEDVVGGDARSERSPALGCK